MGVGVAGAGVGAEGNGVEVTGGVGEGGMAGGRVEVEAGGVVALMAASLACSS